MNISSAQIKRTLYDAYVLWKKSLYKTLEFQLLFKLFYVFALFWIISFIVEKIINVIDFLSAQVAQDAPLAHISISPIINEVAIITSIVATSLAFFYVYHIEKNGITIITTEYHRNHYISFVRTLFFAVVRTPVFLFRRIVEMRTLILLLLLLFVAYRALVFFDVNTRTVSSFSFAVSVYGAILYFAILLRQTFTSHITCLEPTESAAAFNKKISPSFLAMRIVLTIIFYTILIFIFCVWIFLFSVVAYILFFDDVYVHDLTSYIMAFYVAFTIVSIAIVFSLLKSFKSCIMSVLYYQQRQLQHKEISYLPKKNPPFHTLSLRNAIALIALPMLVSTTVLAISIKSRTDTLFEQSATISSHVQQINTKQIDQFSLEKVPHIKLSRNDDLLDTIEEYILLYLAYINQKK